MTARKIRDAETPSTSTEETGTSESLQMEPELMRALAQKAAELVVEWMEEMPKQNAWDGEFKKELEDQLMEDAPEEGRPATEILEQVAHDILPVAARHAHPRSFAFIPSSPTWPGVLADFMAAGYNINSATWLTASGPSQIELTVIDWFRRWLGYPNGAGGLLTSGGSAASLDALVAAREAAGNPERGVVYMSDQSHTVQVRAAKIVGVRPEHIRMIPCDECFRIDMKALARAVAEDRAAGLDPFAVCANAGTSSTGAVDPLEAMADFCEKQGIWLHVDAAYGGFAVVTQKGKKLLRGIERADSVVLDAHKWFFQPYEAGGLLVKDIRTLEHAFTIHHDVLQDTLWGADHPNFSDHGLQLSRSFRALKIWMSVQTFGLAAFRKAVSKGMELASRAGEYVEENKNFELLSPVTLSVVCFRINPAEAHLGEGALEEINRAVLARIFWDNRALMSSTTLGKTFSLRLCILNHTTAWSDVRETLEAIERFGEEALEAQK